MVNVSLTVPPDVVLPDITTRTDLPSDTSSDSRVVNDDPLPGLSVSGTNDSTNADSNPLTSAVMFSSSLFPVFLIDTVNHESTSVLLILADIISMESLDNCVLTISVDITRTIDATLTAMPISSTVASMFDMA